MLSDQLALLRLIRPPRPKDTCFVSFNSEPLTVSGVFASKCDC